jgi:hypothetical protein
MSETPSTHPSKETVIWVADCGPNVCVWGRLIKEFPTQDEREAWASAHEAKLGHRVLRYMRIKRSSPPQAE